MTSESVGDGELEASAPSPGVPLQGRIGHVTGRKAEGGQRGLPALDQLSISLSDGTTHDFGPPNAGQSSSVTLLGVIPYGEFQQQGQPCCPICLDKGPLLKEHVPQKNLGGQVMTMTCQRCNSGFGSKVEADLQHWFDHAKVNVALDHDGPVQGRRRAPTMYYREAVGGGSFALFVDGEFTPEVEEMMKAGRFNLNYREPDPRRFRMALLKHAYLAACLCLRNVLDTPDAQATRADLLAVRDAPKKSQPPESEAANRLHVYRSHVGAQGPPLALVAHRDADDDGEPEVLISLAGALFVSWPFPDCPPGTWKRT